MCGICSVNGGHCTDDPRTCVMLQQMQRIEAMKKTTFYCPECEAVGKREYLYTDGDTFVCRLCNARYTKVELAEAYSDELSALEDSAGYVRIQIRRLLTPERAAA